MLSTRTTLIISGWKSKKDSSPREINNNRVSSIDHLRAITMLLMIFVNDLWSLRNVPVWLEHVPANADGLGLADTVFPAFLFIVGMSIPYSITARRKKGDNIIQLTGHIASRTMALLTMGLFLVNGENINAAATGVSRLAWYVLSCTSFILIWNAYPKTMNSIHKGILQGSGLATLLFLAVLYRGGDADNLKGFSIYWWGILGLIGWCYFTSALITAFAGKRTQLVAAWLLFVALSMISSAGLLPKNSLLNSIPNPILSGTLVAFTLGGVLTTQLFQHFQKQDAPKKMITTLIVLALGLIGLGMYTNRYWDISKIRATAPWLFLCSGFTILAFAAIYWVSDVKEKTGWLEGIRPAGTNTLLCYLIPYFAYAVIGASGLTLPEFMITGIAGLLKSFAFALLCIWMTGLLTRIGIRLKL